MKILNCGFTFLSKFTVNNLSSCEKLQHFQVKSVLSQKTCASLIVAAHRWKTVNSKTSPARILFRYGGKCFPESENEYAHKVMEKLHNYSNSLLMFPLEVNKYTLKNELATENLNPIEKFIKITLDNLSEGLHLGNEKFTDIVQNLCSSLPEASDEEIKVILHNLCLWPPTPSTKTLNFQPIWTILDKECVKRMKRWDVNQQLLIADYWFYLRLSRISRYNKEVISNLVHNIDSLLNHQVVQLMFYINLQRKIPAVLISSVEKKLESVIKSVTLEEMGVICLGFFKTENKISNSDLIQYIIKKFMCNVENVNTITVAAILKFLRKSLNRKLTDLYILTMHKCINCVSKWDIPTSIHLALLSSECNVYHPLLLNCVSEKLANEIENARIKDCAKLLVSLSMYNHFEGEFHDLFLSELQKEERQDEFNSYPVHVIHTAIYYAYMGHYNYELLAKVFEKRFFDNACLKLPAVCTVFAELDCCVEIECQDYMGPKLDISVRKSLRNQRGNLPTESQDQSMQTRLLNDVYKSLVEIFGSEKNILIRHILPHIYSPDIIVRLSKFENKSLSDLYQDYPSDQILKPPSHNVWASVVIGACFSFAYRSTHMTGITAMKLRQLKKIGYEILFIPYFDIPRNVSLRKKFLEEKLNELQACVKTQHTLSND